MGYAIYALLDEDIYTALCALCDKTGYSKRMIVEDALRQYLEGKKS